MSGFNTMTRHDTSALLQIDANATSNHIHLHPIRMANDLLRTQCTWHVAGGIGHQHWLRRTARYGYVDLHACWILLVCCFYNVTSKTKSWSFATLEGFQSSCHVCVCVCDGIRRLSAGTTFLHCFRISSGNSEDRFLVATACLDTCPCLNKRPSKNSWPIRIIRSMFYYRRLIKA